MYTEFIRYERVVFHECIQKVILLYSIVSVFLVSCFSILDATDAVAKDLRGSIGGAFYLLPSSKLDFIDGQMEQTEGSPPVISEDVIKEILCGITMGKVAAIASYTIIRLKPKDILTKMN